MRCQLRVCPSVRLASMELPGESISVSDIKTAMETQKIQYHKRTVVFPFCASSVSPPVLQMHMKDVSNNQTDLVHVLDDIGIVDTQFDWEKLTEELDRENPNYANLPYPLCPKGVLPPETTMQLAIVDVPGAAGRHAILKWFTFKRNGENVKATRQIATGVCHKPAKMINIGSGKQSTIYFHYLFECMGGWQARTQSLSLKVKEQAGGKEVNNFMSTLSDEAVSTWPFHISFLVLFFMGCLARCLEPVHKPFGAEGKPNIK